MAEIKIHNVDVIEWLKNYAGEKFHAVISDPPYGLAFMGKSWDKYTPRFLVAVVKSSVLCFRDGML